MVNRTSDEYLKRSATTTGGTKFFMKENFDLKIYASDKYTSNNPSLLCRMRNQLIKAIEENILLPQIIVIIFDRDFIATVSHNDCGISLICGIDIDWLAKEFNRIIVAHKDRLPNKSVSHEAPKLIWMQAPLHTGFTDNARRVKFNKALQHIVSFYPDMITMRMVKEWNYNDSSIFITTAKRFTSDGLRRYWSSIDSAIEHWANYLSRRTKFEVSAQVPQEKTPAKFITKIKQDFNFKNRFKWTNSKLKKRKPTKDKQQRFQLPKPASQ